MEGIYKEGIGGYFRGYGATEMIEKCKPNIELIIRADRSTEARSLLVREGCKIFNVVELRSPIGGMKNGILQFIVECPGDKLDKVKEIGFQTFVDNPDYQKYYKPKGDPRIVESNLKKVRQLNKEV